MPKAVKLYDFKDAMSRALAYFPQLNPNNTLISIDSLRGICTSTALIRLNRVAQIKKSGNCFKIGSSGIRLKLKKIKNQDKFTFEIFGISQYYKLTKEAQRQHKAILRYLTTHKSFEILNTDIAIDLPHKQMPQVPTPQQKKQIFHKGTLYIQDDDVKICVYDKCKKHTNDTTSRLLPKKLIRHEVTLKLAKKDQLQKPRKALATAKTTYQTPLIRNNKRILKEYNKHTKSNQYKPKLYIKKHSYSVREFYYNYLSKKCSSEPYSKDTS